MHVCSVVKIINHYTFLRNINDSNLYWIIVNTQETQKALLVEAVVRIFPTSVETTKCTDQTCAYCPR